MKQVLFSLLLVLPQMCFAQNESKIHQIAKVFEQISKTIESGGSQVKLKELATTLKTYHIVPVRDNLMKGDTQNVEMPLGKDHLIFITEVIDSLAEGNNSHVYAISAYKKFKRLKKSETSGIDACTTTKVLKARSKHKFTLKTYDKQEIAVVAEPYGRLTLLLRDLKNGRDVTEREKETEGKLLRYLYYDYDKNREQCYDLEIVVENRSSFDISYVIILN